MYRASKYDISWESLYNFAELFNRESKFKHIQIYPAKEENFIDDGFIRNELTGEKIIFDWEIRDRYFKLYKITERFLGE